VDNTSHPVTVPSDYAELVSPSDGSFSVRLGGKLQDAVLNAHWYEQVTEGPAWRLLESILVNYQTAWGELDEIQTRFLDALAWHSDAISDPDLGARIVKFWTAVERLLSTSHGSKISARAAILSSGTPEEFEANAAALSAAYQKRSDVVHGNANRANESWYTAAARTSEEASRTVLFQYLYAIQGIRCQTQKNDRDKLQAWLKWLDAMAECYRKQLRKDRSRSCL
jgi:Apea-like HEPN